MTLHEVEEHETEGDHEEEILEHPGTGQNPYPELMRDTSFIRFLLVTRAGEHPDSFTLQYDESHGDYCWSAERMTARTFAGFDFSTPCSVFIRGISIALGEPLWKRNLPLVPPKEVPIYEVYAKPLFEPQDSYGRILEWAKGLDRLPSPSRPTIMFHPSMILLQLMIDTAPSVDVAFADDCIWRPLVGSHHLTHPRLVEFMKRVLEQYDLSVVEGVATLVKRPEEQNAPAKASIEGCHQACYRDIRIWSTMNIERQLEVVVPRRKKLR